MQEVNENIIREIYKKRPIESRKYDYGLLLVIGGSKFYSGSPAFSALAAFRAGVDMVRVIAPKRAADIIASFTPDLAAYPLEGDLMVEEHLPILLSMTESAKAVSRGNIAVVVGGGIGRSPEPQQTILKYISRIDCPAVIDADAIYAVPKKREVFARENFLFTPHGYEFFVLTGKEVIGKPLEEKIEIVKAEAKRLGITILLKGHVDIISDGKEVALNKTGCEYMTVGGSGDTLAGIAGALLARKVPIFEAAKAAAFINGKAGELAAQKLGESMIASDIIQEIPEVLKKYIG